MVIDRIVVKEGISSRVADSLETALQLGEGKVIVDVIGEEELLFSENHACPIVDFPSVNLSRGCFPLIVHLVPALNVMV